MNKLMCVAVMMFAASSAFGQWSRSAEAVPSATRSYGGFTVVSQPSAGGVILTPAHATGGVYVTDSYCYGPSGLDTPVSASYTLRAISAPFPMTVEASIQGPLVARSTSYNAGDVVVVPSASAWPPETTEYAYRAQNGGTTSAAGAVYATNKGGATVDGGVTWINLGSVLTMQPIVTTGGAAAYTVNATLPAHSNVISVQYALWFATVATPTPADGAAVELTDVTIPSASFCPK